MMLPRKTTAGLLGAICGATLARWLEPAAVPVVLGAAALVAAAPAVVALAQQGGGPQMPPPLPGGPLKGAQKQEDEIKKDLGPAAKNGDLKAAKKLVDYLLYKHQFPRAAAYEALASVGHDKVLEWLCQEPLFHQHPVVRSDVIDALVANQYAKAVPALVKLLGSEKENRQQLVAAIATLGGKDQAALLAKTAKSEHDPYAHAEALEQLAHISPDDCRTLAKAAALDKEPEVRVGAIRALSSFDEDAAFDAAMANLRERKTQVEKKQKKGDWQPALVSIRRLLETRQREKRAAEYREAMDILILLLEPKGGEQGRMKHEVIEAVRALSEKPDLADDYESLKQWWEVVREKFTPKDLAAAPSGGSGGGSTGGSSGRKPRKPKGGGGGESGGEKGEPAPSPASGGGSPAAEPASVGTAVRFHGIPIWSDHVDFVIDSSGSMDTPIPVPPPEEPAGPSGTGERDKPKAPPATEKPKKDLSREELIKTVHSLPENMFFNVISYGDLATAWKSQLVAATKPAKADVESWTGQLKLGRTNYFAALMLPLTDTSVDTVYFLTDGGSATDGRYTDQERIVDRILQVNKYSLVEFNCILFCDQKDQQSSSNRKWLEQICTPSGGKLYLRPEYK